MAMDTYSTLHRLLKRYRNYRDGAHDLLECLETQEIIFSNETVLLLTPILGSRQAQEMIRDSGHPAWKDSAIDLDLVLGEMREPLTSAASRVCRRMRGFQEELMGLDSEKSQPSPEDKTEPRKSLRRRFRYAFSEKNLSDLANSIRKATKDYRILRAQFQDLTHSRPNKRVDSEKRSAEQSKRVEMTRAAANQMYKALSKACTIHVQHEAHVSLKPTYGSSERAQDIKFKLAFRQTQHTNTSSLDETLWFVVETLFSKRTEAQLENQPQMLSKRPASPVLGLLQATTHFSAKRVRFSQSDPVITTSSSNIVPIPLSPPHLPNLTLNHNFCTHLRSSCDPKTCQDGLCIGLLEDSEEWRLPVYSTRGPASCHKQGLNKLSAMLISNEGQCSKLGRIPIVQRLQYAKLLSQATLNYFATPWMQSPWSSKDIIVYDTATFSAVSPEHIQEAELFVNFFVRDLTSDNPDHCSKFDPPFIHNATLFNLGVVLLELAHECPIQEMGIESDNVPGLPPAMADYFAAFRQTKEVTSCLGPKFSDIVRKCLHCDFGQGWDLQNPSLQDAVHREVVSELDRLEMGLRGLGIG
ncbi:uncharacterized protein KY384_001638 [Bacidia gigantensis]|uniref:uncharacterized protein n=1 Tax=Bacidia gigantensis TaxID=2732470 RepID=UPI001D03821D|nr:uncharacterized protein KY384_001638 [Bacidia gigantensis]KAG8533897.1 hypothetical protein KY384_001638 [Bacidia gigantensis]